MGIFARFKRLRPQAEIKIGVLASTSGPMADYGCTALQGFDLGINYATGGSGKVAGRAIRLLIEDDQGDEHLAAQKAEHLLDVAGAELLQGCTSSQAAIKISRLAQERERLFMVAVAATDVLTAEWFNPYIFRTASTTAQDAAAGGLYAVQNLGRNFCFLSQDYIWGQQSRAAWWRTIAKHGGEIVGDIFAPYETTDFRPYLRETLEKHPEVLVPSWAGATVKELLLQMRAEGVFDALKVAGNLVDRATLEQVGEAVAGMICAVKYHHALPQTSLNEWLVRHHRERYGDDPDLLAESGFTSAVALVEALKRTDGDPDAGRLIPILEGMVFKGPKGTYTFRPEDHQALQPMYVAEMTSVANKPYCEPRLIAEIAAEDCAPPLVQPRSQH